MQTPETPVTRFPWATLGAIFAVCGALGTLLVLALPHPSPAFTVPLLTSLLTIALCHVLVGLPLRRAHHAERERADTVRYRLEEAERIGKIGWWGYDFRADRIEASDEVLKLFGKEPGTAPLTNREFLSLVHEKDREAVEEAQREALKHKEPFEVEYRVESGSGLRWIQQRADTEFDALGRAVSSFGTIQDVTESRDAEQARSAFIGTITHELRTPLTSIAGSLALVRAGALGELPPKAASACAIAHKNSERLAKLINDILDAEKLASGQMRMETRSHDLSEIIEEAIQVNDSYGASLGVTFRAELPLIPVYVECDRDRLIQVLSNLLSNAAKFSETGDLVRVRLTPLAFHARLEVIDRGAGIPAAVQPRIFERFTQAHARTQRTANGTGLGLSIAKAIVEAHCGHIGFESKEGVGTTFSVSLPLANQIFHDESLGTEEASAA